KLKLDNITGATTTYHYDIDDPVTYGSQNNRLMSYEARDSADALLETVWYAYHVGGHVDQIVRKPASDSYYHRLYFLYDAEGRTWMTVADRWTNSGAGPTNCQRLWAREFRYDGSGRARCLVRACDPDTLVPCSANDGVWSDY